MELKPFYWNFDGLDVAFQGRIPEPLVNALHDAKEQAQETQGPALVEWRGEPMHVAESGAKGGYAYRCDTGPVGATWFFSKNQNPENWNIRVSAKSSALASMGFEGYRNELTRFLDAIGADVRNESISRVDFCMDFLASDIEAATGEPFILDPTAFVIHSHMSRADHDDDAGMRMHGVSGRYSSVTCGKMPGWQVIVYEKSREVRSKQKPVWWAHWNAARKSLKLPPLTGDETIWRVELRAGKDHLKDRWGLRSWGDLDEKYGDLIMLATQSARYAIINPNNKDRSRWKNHPVWDAVTKTCQSALRDMTNGLCPDGVIEVEREKKALEITTQLEGLVPSVIELNGYPTDVMSVKDAIGNIAGNLVRHGRKRFDEGRKRAHDKYRFVR